MQGQIAFRTNPVCVRRLRKELEQLRQSSDEFVQLACSDEESWQRWVASIRGPPGSYYDGYIFDVETNIVPWNSLI